MITIHPQYLSLSKLLDGRLFRIPDYQRAYSWTAYERADLFADIKNVHAKGRDEGHFMAAVVCLRRDKQVLGTDEFYELDIVDGQQRLTTLILLLNAIRLALDDSAKAEQKLSIELGELLVKSEGDELLLLQTNHDSSHYFTNYLRNGVGEKSTSAKTISDREILAAIEDCREFVAMWANENGDLMSLAATVKNKLYFLLHETEDEKSVYTVFEVLNSRGLEVSWFDRLKSILMGAAFELKGTVQKSVIAELHRTWRDIYSVIGLRQGMSTEALRFAATLWFKTAPNRPLGEKDSVDVFRSSLQSAKQIREVASWLLSVVKACDKVASNPRINAVTRIAQARLLASSIYLRDDISEQRKQTLLGRWEKVTFRIYGMLANDARTRVGDYVRLAWKVRNEKLSFAAIDDAIRAIGKDFTIQDAVDNLRNDNCYEGWESELRYFMYRYEEHLAKVQKQNFSNEQWERIWMASASDSIEHIFPKSKASEKNKHRLGNLVLLPPKLNSKLNASDPVDKASAYRKTGLLIAGEVADSIDESGWKSKSIDEREESLLKWASSEWKD